jgi:polyhydroxyalkanoate synthesis regulator phasin
MIGHSDLRHSSFRNTMDGKAKKRIEVIKQKLQLLRQKLAGAKRQDDEPGEVKKLEQEIAGLEAEAAKLRG